MVALEAIDHIHTLRRLAQAEEREPKLIAAFEQAKAARITSNTVCGLPKEPKSIDDDDATSSSKEVSMSQEACQAPAL